MQEPITPFNPFSLASKNILITGASSGIGRSCCVEADKMGASLFLFGRDKGRLMETLDLTIHQERHQVFVMDITRFDEVEQLFSHFKETGVKFQGVIHSAGISTTLPLKRSKPDKIQKIIETNVSAAILISQLITQKFFLDQRGASVVFISSVMGLVGEVGKTLYGITKGALISASCSMALELAPRNVRVNSVSPGVVETPMSQNAIYSRDEEARRRAEMLHPLGFGQPEDIAYACIYLLSDAARWITGSNLVIDGGYTAR